MKNNHLWIVWAAVLGVIAGMLVLAPYLTDHDPFRTEPTNQFASPDAQHWLGTDHFGRDVLSRTLWGARRSFSSAALAAVVAVGVGVLAGGLAGVIGSWLDWLLMRTVDVLLAFPGLLLAMALIVILGREQWSAAVAVGIALSPAQARVVRAAVLSIYPRPYVEAARVAGAGPWRILMVHVLPNVAEQVVAYIAVIYAWALLNMAALDYLGLTESLSIATLGRLLAEGRAYLRVAPWIAGSPGVVLTVSVMAITGVSDAWRRRLPRNL